MGKASPPDIPLTPQNILNLQQTIGNQAFGHMIQAKSKIGQPGDKYEQEAERAAERHMSGAPHGQRSGSPAENREHPVELLRKTPGNENVLQLKPDKLSVGKKYIVKTLKGGNLMLRVQPTHERYLGENKTNPNTVGNIKSGTEATIKEVRLYSWYVIEAKTLEHGNRTGFVHKK